jgi:hypothetical protein
MSNTFSIGLPTKKLEPPIAIRLATPRGSKTVAKEEVDVNVEIARGTAVKLNFLIVPVKDYAGILVMVFLQKYAVTLDTAGLRPKFGRFNNYEIKCQEFSTSAASNSTAVTNVSTAATLLPSNELPPEEEDVCGKKKEVPDFKKEFPKEFPDKEPEELPPLRGNCNPGLGLFRRKNIYSRDGTCL